jgi:hypothetical protein
MNEVLSCILNSLYLDQSGVQSPLHNVLLFWPSTLAMAPNHRSRLSFAKGAWTKLLSGFLLKP